MYMVVIPIPVAVFLRHGADGQRRRVMQVKPDGKSWAFPAVSLTVRLISMEEKRTHLNVN